MRHILKVSLTYTAIVFGAGFILGTIRVLLVIPKIGMRYAELLELPLMILVCWLSARFVVSRWVPLNTGERVAMGAVSLVLLVALELALVFSQGISLSEYVASRDPVSGTAYLLSLLVFAVLPLLVHRGGEGNAAAKSDDLLQL